ncbi:MAG: PD-(D/E)XK nuclease family protein, partial [Mailhella sp.]
HIGERVKLTPPPAPAMWQAKKGRALELPKKISPSTLESALACPAAWYFKNILGLDCERNKLSGDPIICGNLAHEVMQRLLKEKRDTPAEYTEEELHKHISAMIDELAQDKAARMALPEYKVLRKSMASRLVRSFRAFCKRMEDDGLSFLESEQTYKGMLGTAECTGRYDLVLTRQGSCKPSVVADMKWSRRKIYREQTQEGRAVQLSAYHFLLDKGRKVTGWKDGEAVLAPSAPVQLESAWFFLLPEALIHSSPIPLSEQWKNIEEAWQGMCTALAEGRLPLADSGEGQTAAAKKANDSPCTFCSYKRLCRRPQEADGIAEDSTEEQE